MRLLAVAAVLAVAGCGSKKSKPEPPAAAGEDAASATVAPPDELAGWRANLDTIAAELPKRHPAPFTRTPEDVFAEHVADLRDKLAIMSNEQRIAGLARIVALVG